MLRQLLRSMRVLREWVQPGEMLDCRFKRHGVTHICWVGRSEAAEFLNELIAIFWGVHGGRGDDLTS
jgi:hypothetical protein